MNNIYLEEGCSYSPGQSVGPKYDFGIKLCSDFQLIICPDLFRQYIKFIRTYLNSPLSTTMISYLIPN